MSPRLGIDDLPWNDCVAEGEDGIVVLEELREMLCIAQEGRQRIAAHDEFYQVGRMGNQSLLDLLALSIPRDLRVELLQRLAKVERFGDQELACFDVRMADGATHTAPTVVWAACETASGRTVGCISPSYAGRSGNLTLCLCDGLPSRPLQVYFVAGRTGYRELFRYAIVREKADVKAFIALAPDAYPDLAFVDGAIRGCRDLSQPFVSRRDKIMEHLRVLNDHGAIAFAMRTHSAIQGEFAKYGVDISPENTETKRDSKCRREREREYLGDVLYFDWHTKIEPDRDRIHVHPPIERSGYRVIVGIIHKHLSLPGD